MPQAGFSYYEGLTNTKNLLADIKDKIMTAYASGTNKWTIVKEVKDAQLRTTQLYLKGIADNGANVYLFLDNTAMNMKSIKVQTAEAMSDDGSTVTLTNPAFQGDFFWVKPASVAPRDLNTPITYFLSVTNNRIILILQGDPTIDFTGYVKNMLYIGTIKSMDGTDTQNICITYGTETSVAAQTTYGQYTSDGVNTIAMLKTKSGVYWQKHYPAFITQQQSLGLEATGFNASRWTGKYHLSPMYVIHPYDGYRGTLDGVIAVDKNNILHLDELLVETATEGVKDRYKYFDLNTTYDMFVNAPHTNEGIAVLKDPSITG